VSAFDTCARCGGSLDVGGAVLVCSRCQRAEVRARRSRLSLPNLPLPFETAGAPGPLPVVAASRSAPPRQLDAFNLELSEEW
jgi:hypothetical protein